MIPFNKPWLSGKELSFIEASFKNEKMAGNGIFTQKCENFMKSIIGCKKCLMTSSCTDALEMCAILADVKAGDEVIVPSYTFVSTALAFVRQGAKIVFADSRKDTPCIDESSIESLITPKTRVIVVVHYAGVACDMDVIMEIANRYNLIVVEDAAQAIDSNYKGIPLGSIGHLSAFSFHETKNIHCGEGGMLCINDEKFVSRAEIIWEKGTNRSAFFRGQVDKYGWVDTGSSFLPADYVAAFLFSQLEQLDIIQKKRIHIWNLYYEGLKESCKEMLPIIPEYATNNAHAFYLVCSSLAVRTNLINYLKQNDIQSVFHYQSLHQSVYIQNNQKAEVSLPQSDRYTDCLLRLPMFYELTDENVAYIVDKVNCFFKNNI